ncbi:hypothetical protein ACLKA7_003919 [Drosophila subpalustris]
MLLPLLLLSFLCAHFANEAANYLLSIKYPNLTISKSKKIRTLIDTPKNAGIFHFLLQVEGSCDFERIKRAYAQQLIELKDKAGTLKFPKLRQKLVTCWGHYAWVNDSSGFNINNHVLLSTHKYRGRPVTESNIQEYVSELAAKYIPSDLPQWQVTVIPNSDPSQPYYILVKLHHLIIAEEEDLHVGEILLLQDTDRKTLLSLQDELAMPTHSNQLSHFIRQPEHISKLLSHLRHLISCRWQQFIYEFESLDTPDGVRAHPDAQNLSQLLSLVLIVFVNVFLGYWRTRSMRRKLHRRSGGYRTDVGVLQTLYLLLLRELGQRNLNWAVARSALGHSLQPGNMVKAWTRFVGRLALNNVILLPYHIYCELLALLDVLLRGQTSYSSTYCACLQLYVPLLIYAQLELVKICYEVFKAPRNIFEVLFVQPTNELNILHKKSYAGRKIVSFSRSIDGALLRERHQHLFGQKIRESDFSLACLAGAVHDYFSTFSDTAAVPALLNTTCRTISKGYFTDRSGGKSDHIGGVVFLQLPLGPPDALKAHQLHEIVDRIRRQQIMIYLASIGQTKYSLLTALFPHVLTKIFINFFSYNFPVTITEIYGAADTKFLSAWGQRVQDVLLFRPPQSKTCLSLNLHRFGDKYRLAIMADTHLAPDHTLLTQSFERYMETVTLELLLLETRSSFSFPIRRRTQREWETVDLSETLPWLVVPGITQLPGITLDSIRFDLTMLQLVLILALSICGRALADEEPVHIVGSSRPATDAHQLKLWLTISARKRFLEVSWKHAPARDGDNVLLTAQDPLSFEQRSTPIGTPLAAFQSHGEEGSGFGAEDEVAYVPINGYTSTPSSRSAAEPSKSPVFWVANGGSTEIVAAIKPSLSAQWFTTGVPFDYALSRNVSTQSSCYGYWASYIDAHGSILSKTCVRAYPRWMTEMRDVVGDLRLRDLFIPGTHDSGSYRPNFDPLLRESVVTKYALTQDDDIRGQLMHGARYLDIRVGYFRSAPEKFFIYHGITRQRPLQEVIEQVKDFVFETNEIVIFGLKEFPVGFGKGLGVHHLLVSYLREQFGDLVVHPSLTWHATMRDIWKRKQNVILAYDKDQMVQEYPQTLFGGVEQRWGNVQSWARLERHLRFINGFDMSRFSSRPVVDMAELTPETWGVILDKHGGLRKMADQVNWRISQLYRDELGNNANIVAADFIRGTTLMDTAIELNRRKVVY